MKMSLAVMTALAAFAAPARAQVRAVPSMVHAQYGVAIPPCSGNPLVQPGHGVGSLPNDGDCGPSPVDPPMIQPVDPPTNNPAPCRYDDCPGGTGLDGGYHVQVEKLRGGDFAAKRDALNALFDNMSAKAAADTAVFADEGAAGRAPLAPASSLGFGETARRVVGFVPSPFTGQQNAQQGASWALIGAGMLALGGLLLRRRGGPQLVLAGDDKDERTDPDSRWNNPQHDPDIERGWKDNQARHRDEETVKDSSSTITNGDNWTGGNDNLHPDRNAGSVLAMPRPVPIRPMIPR